MQVCLLCHLLNVSHKSDFNFFVFFTVVHYQVNAFCCEIIFQQTRWRIDPIDYLNDPEVLTKEVFYNLVLVAVKVLFSC